VSAIHPESSPLAGQTVKLREGVQGPFGGDASGAEYRIDDWADRVFDKSWGVMEGNPACLVYAIRAAVAGLPTDDEVFYGKVGAFGQLIHVTEVITEVTA